MPAIFPAPDHDHARCTAHAITYAEAVCAARVQRLTAPRRQVLEMLASSHKPIGVYDIIDLIARKHKVRPAPRHGTQVNAAPPNMTCCCVYGSSMPLWTTRESKN